MSRDVLSHAGLRLSDFFALLALFTAALFAGRIYFFVIYLDSYSGTGWRPIAASFLQGLRFDLSTASIVSAPFLLALFFPGVSRSRALKRGLMAALLAWHIVLLVYNFIDIQYYAFAQRHLTFEVGNTWRDADVILKIGLRRYVPELIALVLFLLMFAAAFVAAARKGNASPLAERGRRLSGLAVDAAVFVMVAALIVVSARGGVQMKPLSIKNAFANDQVELGALSLNGVYSTFNTLYNNSGDEDLRILKGMDFEKKADVAGFMVDPAREEGTPGYPLFRRFGYREAERKKLNVVVLIMESWSAKFVGSLGAPVDAAPFFSSLSGKGMLLSNCFANAQRSYEGLTATLGSMPSWKGMSLDQGGVMYQTRLEPAVSVMRRYGYETVFVHGARPGSLGFDSLVRRFGFQRHVSRDDFTGLDRVDDGIWGVYDEHAFLRANEEFKKIDGPFFGVVYSLSSHTPYKLPSKEFEHFGREVADRDFLNSMRYSDYALRRFFEEAGKSGYFKDTVFVIVADHGEGGATGGSIYDGYRIPCLFYGPGIKPSVYGGVASQVDVLPTVFDLLKVPAPFTSWGKSVLAGGERRALLPRGDLFVWVDGRHMLLADLSAPHGVYDYRTAPDRDVMKDGSGPGHKGLMEEFQQYMRFSYDLILSNSVRPPQ